MGPTAARVATRVAATAATAAARAAAARAAAARAAAARAVETVVEQRATAATVPAGWGAGPRVGAVRMWQRVRVRVAGARRRERAERRFDQAIAERFT